MAPEELSTSLMFKRARDFLLRHRLDYGTAYREFRWPEFETFNWAIDWFDFYAKKNSRLALWLEREGDGSYRRTFEELSARSSQVANWLTALGLKPGDRLLVMLPNVVALWEIFLGAIKAGVVLVPTSTLATESELKDRIERGRIKMVFTDEGGANKLDGIPGNHAKVVVGKKVGWVCFSEVSTFPDRFTPDAPTRPTDPCLLYFTSGTTAKPKLVLHTHSSYPVGHLSTMYWVGIQEKDIHQNISSPGWAKHAWSSLFAPWNAGATIFVHEAPRFQPALTKHWLQAAKVSTLCAPPTVWRMLILESLGPKPEALRELSSAGEPLNPEVIEQVHKAWGLSIRDGYGQTETTAQIGNSPGQKIKVGSMGRPLPGYQISLVEGEIALSLSPRPAGLMTGYEDDPSRTELVTAGGYYRTGDEATIDEDGYVHFVGRGDDIFKSSDYRISPFELESVLLEHPFVAEAAVVPAPDPVRHTVPKAFVLLKKGIEPTRENALKILHETNHKMAPYKKIRCIEFGELPKTISGKIRRVQLRGMKGPAEFWL